MNEPFHESLTVWRFIRRHFVRIVIGAVLAVAVYGMLAIWMPYQRERRIAQKIEALGGYVVFKFAGPYWIPQSMWDRATLFNRVLGLDLYDDRITDAGMEHVKGLTNLIIVDLRSTQVTDSGLEHLKGRNRSHLGEERGCLKSVSLCVDGIAEELKRASFLLAAGLQHREQAFDEAASVGALCAEGEASPDDGMSQRTFGGIIGRLDIFAVLKHPEVGGVGQKFRACGSGGGIGAAATLGQKGFHI